MIADAPFARLWPPALLEALRHETRLAYVQIKRLTAGRVGNEPLTAQPSERRAKAIAPLLAIDTIVTVAVA